MANILNTHTQCAELHLSPQHGARLAGGKNAFTEAEHKWGLDLLIGPLQFGQTREIVIPMELPPVQDPNVSYLDVTLQYARQGRVTCRGTSRRSDPTAEVARIRALVIEECGRAVFEASESRLPQAHAIIRELLQQIRQSNEVSDERVVVCFFIFIFILFFY